MNQYKMLRSNDEEHKQFLLLAVRSYSKQSRQEHAHTDAAVTVDIKLSNNCHTTQVFTSECLLIYTEEL